MKKDWDPNDPKLKSPYAPHETAAVLRMHRVGFKGAHTMKLLKLRGTQLMNQIQRAMDAEQAAHRAGRPIHDAGVVKQ
ncbi:hypothetical protein SEA_LAKES_74 [Mycobacterium phage Lakes]|uniref:Gene 68 protein n=7 Tax=root TaxID=1 RepID=VG68_BPMD2|nr:hypothetical protein PBI_D29_68 [Mycobacterium phage D29]YP_008058340.1 hypothetical protein M178_gp66 [Mycobacterium phage Chy5]YP_008060227.1 hypothetical protein M179_gp67 [Mycobacterium phage Chy4]O64260.1 RecName: Full=Gene 68 protein; AltName: Full=Gp68 [Fromanvirus D29]AGK85833.1 hypothetical protein Chy1_0066 [Mycobacterium phage Chy1]AOQ27905.1 hypothetical protein SEA_POMAR16_73 [Mycobacterium phage Pomar16]APC43122.1 hypothetical protein SEA_KERBEROS_74 [Mycobacterium phage Kerb